MSTVWNYTVFFGRSIIWARSGRAVESFVEVHQQVQSFDMWRQLRGFASQGLSAILATRDAVTPLRVVVVAAVGLSDTSDLELHAFSFAHNMDEDRDLT